MKKRIESLGSGVFVVLLMTSLLVVLTPLATVSAPPTYQVGLMIDMKNYIDFYNVHQTMFYREGMPGGSIHTRVFVWNLGNTIDNINLTVDDKGVWGSTISPSAIKNLPPGKYAEAELTIPINALTPIGTEDNVWVKAKSANDPLKENENFITARASRRLWPANQDTFVDNSYPNDPKDANGPVELNPRGKLESMYIGYYSSTQAWEYGYYKFDLRAIAPGTDIKLVRLAIYAYRGYPTGESHGWYTVHHVDNDNWAEENVTWNKQPGYNENVTPPQHISGILYDGDNWLYWDVTEIVKAEFYNGDNVLSLVVKKEDLPWNENGESLYTRSRQYWSATGDGYKYWPYLDMGGRGMSVKIDPPIRHAFAGGTFYYTVTVTNNNSLDNDNYNLEVSDNAAGWASKLQENKFENVPVGESRTTKVYVTAPLSAQKWVDNDKITVTGKSYDNVATALDSSTACIFDNLLQPTEDDIWAEEGYPDNNFNSDTWTRVESYPVNEKSARTFLKFDLRGIPPDNNIASAKLILWCWVAAYDNIYAQVCTVDNDNWTEENLTWRNQPTYGDVLDTVNLGSLPWVVENTYISWDVTPYVAGQRLTDNIASFCIKAEVENTSGRYQFDSKEYKNYLWDNVEPMLQITLGPPTENIRKVSVSISPVHRVGDNGENRTYTVKVMNMGNVTDSYTLENTDSAVWSKTLTSSSFTDVKPGESKTATLTVTLSSTPGAEDNIWVAAISQTDSLVKDNKKCTASVRRLNGWEVAGYAPKVDNYAVAVTGAGGYIYVANSNTLGTWVNFMRCDNTGEWKYLSTPAIATPFKNGTCLAWDKGDYIYALLGGAYGDNKDNQSARHYFYRYKIPTNTWEMLRPTGNTDNENNNLGAQGAGDALAVAYGGTSYGSVYAIVGNRQIGSTFWKYRIADNSWTQLTMPTGWTSTDDGCSLVWTGVEYLYALRGESTGGGIIKSFSRYSIWHDVWTSRADIPEGVGDGGSLLWISGDNIYATAGGNPIGVPENIRENIFFAYSISGNNWTKLENLPKGIGEQNGMRLGSGSGIYCWRGCKNDSVLWVYTVPKLWEVTVDIKLDNAIAVTIDLDGDFFAGENLVAKFYLYKGSTYQDNTIVCSVPGHVTLLENVSRPGKNYISRVELVVVDSVGIQLGTLKIYESSKTKLFDRLSYIDLYWQFASPEKKSQFMSELGDMDLYWPTAPLKFEDL